MEAASGLTIVEEDGCSPLIITSFGTGQLILLTLDRGAVQLITSIGGSATNDGGEGMAADLGYVSYFFMAD